MRSILALSALLAALASQAAPLEYDPAWEASRREMVRLYAKTRICLGDAGRAIMRQGVQEPAMIKHFMASMCAGPFHAFLVADGMPEEQARRTLVELTQKAFCEDITFLVAPAECAKRRQTPYH